MRTRVARVLSCMAMLGVLPASNAHALGVRSPVPVVVRARIDVHVLATETAGAWTVTSRSPADASRFMADLTAGNSATGIAYFKAASMWSEADDALGRVRFRAEQGDYLKEFAGSDSTRAALRLFGDERRFFTGDMGVALVDDDQVDDFEHRFGVRADGATGAWRATYWAAALEADDARRINQYATVRFAPTVACAGVSYLHDNPDAGNNHAVVKGEAAGYYRPATVVLSFEASATGSGMAFPSAPWGNFDAGHYSTTAPSNSATFAEVRTRRTRVGQDNLFDAAYQYTSVGTDYTNDLGTLVPGSEINRAWIDWAHRRYALDARLAAQSEVRRE
ncbi:MAG TPA: hypothetical protein VFH88_13035, partial [Candidatus Krumholzibacteria bacterium]|nr:hypothetical protein [Candidatus Krumholzibacteria bacterium]